MMARKMRVSTEKGLTLKYLQECFDYTDYDGALYWRIRPVEHFTSEMAYASAVTQTLFRRADNLDKQSGYHRVQFTALGKVVRIYAHRVAYILGTLSMPAEGMVIDHIDGDTTNNRLANLRAVTQAQNLWNSPARRARLANRVG